MGQLSSAFQHVTNPITLVGFVLLVLSSLVPLLAGKKGDRQLRRLLVSGLVCIGLLAAIGGIWLESNKERALTTISGVKVTGSGSAVGTGISINGKSPTPPEPTVDIHDVEVSGDNSAVGAGIDIHRPPPAPSHGGDAGHDRGRGGAP
jgi:hypothetical protein